MLESCGTGTGRLPHKIEMDSMITKGGPGPPRAVVTMLMMNYQLYVFQCQSTALLHALASTQGG